MSLGAAAAAAMFPAWSREVPEVLQHHGVASVERGLPTASLEALREKYGYNELQKTPATPLWKLILEQFNDTLVKVPPTAAAACRRSCRSRLRCGCSCCWGQYLCNAIQFAAVVHTLVCPASASLPPAAVRRCSTLQRSMCPPTHLHCLQILLLAAAVSFGLAFVEDDPEESGVRAFMEPLVIVSCQAWWTTAGQGGPAPN